MNIPAAVDQRENDLLVFRQAGLRDRRLNLLLELGEVFRLPLRPEPGDDRLELRLDLIDRRPHRPLESLLDPLHPRVDRVERSDLELDHRPFVDHPDAVHEDVLGVDRDRQGRIERDHLLAELVVAAVPPEHLVRGLQHLVVERLAKVLLAQDVVRRQDVSELLHRFPLDIERLPQLLRRDPA